MNRGVPHIDDGRLHAWLDGALDPESDPDAAAVHHHLEACDECRARLESARVERERARWILASGDHALPEAPPFSDVRERARSKASPGRRRSRRSKNMGLAWAASIAVVAGAGLLGRELAQRRGRDIPAPFDASREVAQEPTEGEARGAQPMEDAISFERQDAARESQVVEDPGRQALAAGQKTEGKAGAEAENLAVAADQDAPQPMLHEKMDANLVGEVAPMAVPPAAEAGGRVEQEAAAGRARFAAHPAQQGSVIGHAGLGCWRLSSDPEVSGAPGWIRLTDERIPGLADGSLRLETDLESAASGSGPVAWLPLGADSVWLSVPPRIFRLAAKDRELDGGGLAAVVPDSAQVSDVRYGRVECPIP